MIGGFGKDEGGFAQASHLELKFATIQSRHPELVSGSIVPQAMTPNGEEWMLKQVQHDGHDKTNFSSTILPQRPPQPHNPPDHLRAARRCALRSEEPPAKRQTLIRQWHAVYCTKQKTT